VCEREREREREFTVSSIENLTNVIHELSYLKNAGAIP
jgi:hypothetical protein